MGMRIRRAPAAVLLAAAAAAAAPAGPPLPAAAAGSGAAQPWEHCEGLGADAYDRPPPADPGRFGYGVLPATAGVHCLINAERRRLGLRELADSGELREAANRHVAAALAQKWWPNPQDPDDRRDPHRNPQAAGTGGEQIVNRVRDAGYCRGGRSWSGYEITYNGWAGAGTPRAAVDWWLNRSTGGHAEIIRDPSLTEFGIAPRGGAAERRGAGASDAGTYVVVLGRCER
ncbi:CAP domain-containing protein [Streptomyces globosus]